MNKSMEIFDANGYVSKWVFDALAKAQASDSRGISKDCVLDAISDLIRYNTVQSVARAGTGHLGASLSIVELLTCIYFEHFSFDAHNKDNNRDVFVLSKGHAVPALYSTLAAKGYIEISELDALRRLGGLQGHCDISTNGVEANTGSLAMGLSKAVGFALAKKRMGYRGKVIAIVGDGELQEGQVWEALLSAASFNLPNLCVIIDFNKVQTDQFVEDITKYGDIERTLEEMGFNVFRSKIACVRDAAFGLDSLDAMGAPKPKVLIADTVKGQGVSFMEHTACLEDHRDRYIWHNKAPNKEQMEQVFAEVFARAGDTLKLLGISNAAGISFPNAETPKKTDEKPAQGEPLTPAFSKALLKAGKNGKIVVFDADLEADCGLTAFRGKYPERFVETGIMEQHMVSSASAFARLGFFPVINSYTAFLTSRANEQLYNYASEGGRGLIVGHMSGVIPATPGKSHQAYRDIACMKSIPGMTMYQPSTPNDCADFLRRVFKGEFEGAVYLRMSMVPSAVKLPDAPAGLEKSKSYVLKDGSDAIIIGIGPVVLGECLAAAEKLGKEGISVEVRSFPWLSAFDAKDLESIAGREIPVLVVEDHYKDGGFGEGFFSAVSKAGLAIKKVSHIAIEGFTTTGFRDETLRHFALDRATIAQKIRGMC